MQFFIGRFAKESKKIITGIAPEAVEELIAYDWPGNVRELANVIGSAILLSPGPTINLQDVSRVLLYGSRNLHPRINPIIKPSIQQRALDRENRDSLLLTKTRNRRKK